MSGWKKGTDEEAMLVGVFPCINRVSRTMLCTRTADTRPFLWVLQLDLVVNTSPPPHLSSPLASLLYSDSFVWITSWNVRRGIWEKMMIKYNQRTTPLCATSPYLFCSVAMVIGTLPANLVRCESFHAVLGGYTWSVDKSYFVHGTTNHVEAYCRCDIWKMRYERCVVPDEGIEWAHAGMVFCSDATVAIRSSNQCGVLTTIAIISKSNALLSSRCRHRHFSHAADPPPWR